MDREEVRRIYESLDEKEKEIIKRRLEDETLLSISLKTHRGYSTVNKINGQILGAFGVKRWGEIKDDLDKMVDKPIEETPEQTGEVEKKKNRSCTITIVFAMMIMPAVAAILGDRLGDRFGEIVDSNDIMSVAIVVYFLIIVWVVIYNVYKYFKRHK